ncbi:MAG: LamG-like jellyroll fold domain-containing protein [Candidatus Hadarchaeales archaeon]
MTDLKSGRILVFFLAFTLIASTSEATVFAQSAPQISAIIILDNIDPEVWFSVGVQISGNASEVLLKLYKAGVSPEAQDSLEEHYTFRWRSGEGFSEVGPGFGYIDPSKSSVSTGLWTFRVKLDRKASPGNWSVWVSVDGSSREFPERFKVNRRENIPVKKTESKPPFFENEWVKENSPVFGPSGSGFDGYAAYNPAVAYHNGVFYMFYRAQASHGGPSVIGMATSTDGINWQRRPNPAIAPTEWYELGGGCEDPRIVKIGETFWMTYTAYDGTTARLALARSANLENWEKVGLAFRDTSLWTKSGAIVPVKINGKYWMYLEAGAGGGDLYYAFSENLTDWTLGGVVMRRRGGYFDALTIEPGPAPFVLQNGIFLLYNSLDAPLGSGGMMRVGWVIFSLKDPTKIVARCEEPFMRPEFSWERTGQVVDCVFAEGLVRVDNIWYLYYGAADMYVGLARAPVRERESLLSVDTQEEWSIGSTSGNLLIKQYGGIELIKLDPIGWWKFDEGSGATAYDSSGYGNHGTVIGASWVTGRIGGALDFPGGTARVEVGDRDILEGLSGLSIVAWINPRSKPHNGEIVKKDIVYLLRVNESARGTTAFMVWDSAGNKYTLEVPDQNFPNNSWSLIAAVWDGSKIRIYKDNAVRLGEAPASFGRLNSNTNSFTIGNQPGGGEGFDGLIDEVMVFGRPLSESEIKILYSGLSEVKTSGQWISNWIDLGQTSSLEFLEVSSKIAQGEEVKILVETSLDGSTAAENTGWITLSGGVEKIPLSLPQTRFVRITFSLRSENVTHSPSVSSFAFYGQAVPIISTTGNPLAVQSGSVLLSGFLEDLDNQETVVWLEWRPAGGSWSQTTKRTMSWREWFSAIVSGIMENSTYEFRAVAMDNNSGKVVMGLVKTFVADFTPPLQFSLISPENGSHLSESPILQWQATSDEISGLSHYEVWINGQNVENVTATTYNTALGENFYEWFVVAVDRMGNRRESGKFIFYLGNVQPPQISLSVSPRSRTVLRGESVTFTITIGYLSGIKLPMYLSVTGLPQDSSASFSQSSGVPSFTSTLTVSVGSNAQAGTYTLRLTVSGGGKMWSENLLLTVRSPAVFVIENMSLSKRRVSPGEKFKVYVWVKNVGDETGQTTIKLAVDNVEKDEKILEIPAGESVYVFFTLSIDESGTHTVNVDGLSESVEVVPSGFPLWVVGVVIAIGGAIFAIFKFFLIK